MALAPVETCEEQCSGIEPAGRVLQVTCGQNRVEFHVHKMRLTGKSVGNVFYLKPNGLPLQSLKTCQECTLQRSGGKILSTKANLSEIG